MSDPLPDIDDKLKKVDLKLKGLDTWVKRIAILGGSIGLIISLLSIWNTWNQIHLTRSQEQLARSQEQLARSQEQRARNEETEKRRVSVKMELKAFNAPVKNAIYLNGTLTNNSARQINILMIGVRIWHHNWSSDIEDDPDYLVYSDNMIANCTPKNCPDSKNTSKTRLLDTKLPIALAPGETLSDTYGPYKISLADWSSGVWIEGRAYTIEQDEGICVLAGPPELEGTFPAVCEESRAKEPECYENAGCLYASTAAFFYKPATR
ncbi:MAG TPA: hypothetical protein VF791_17215 [Pyrinomonadaceae bacterium]